MRWLQCRTHRGWRILLVGKRGQTPHPPKRRRNWDRFTPTAEISIVTSMSETQRSMENPSVPETPSGRPPQNSPQSALPDLPAFVSIWRNSYKASARCTSMGDGIRCTCENCRTLRMTRSSIYTSPIVFGRGERRSSDQQGPFMQSTRSEQLSAVNTFERVHCVDVSHDNRSHPNLAVL